MNNIFTPDLLPDGAAVVSVDDFLLQLTASLHFFEKEIQMRNSACDNYLFYC